jgi:hypothetical protein
MKPDPKGDGRLLPMRDEFSKPTRTALALRAGYRCSFPGCKQLTVGPSDESQIAVAVVGQAAHISAAASGPGARRFDASMTHEQRSDISNAIWLCNNHAALIDRDDTTYTVASLRSMKSAHEAEIRAELSGTRGNQGSDLFALGANLVMVGQLLGGNGTSWEFEIEHFVIGDFAALLSFCAAFDDTPRLDRYVLVNELGDGRLLSDAPRWKRTDGHLTVTVHVERTFPRERAQDLGADLKLGDDHDLVIEGGDLAMISGVDALPQRLKICLSSRKGEWFLERDFGSRLAEYCELYSGSPWLDRLLKLEVIRNAAIPLWDDLHKREYTPLVCVEKVHGFQLLQAPAIGEWNQAKLDLEVGGIGRWTKELSVLLPEEPVEPKMPTIDDLL